MVLERDREDAMDRCRINVTREQTDFGQTVFGARGYLERIGILGSERASIPQFVPNELRAHSIPLFPPLPPARLSGYLLGEPSPDRGQTTEWPHPDA